MSTHHDKLVGLAVLGAIGALALGWQAGPWAAALCGAVLLPALFHRRIKNRAGTKVLYVTAAWVAVVVGLPALEVGAVDATFRIGLIACVYTTAIGANLIASNVPRAEDRTRGQAATAIWAARGLAGVGAVVALLALPTLAALALSAPPGEGPVVALLDARRGEVYAAGYAAPGQLEPEVLPEGLYDAAAIAARLPAKCRLVGEGVAVCGAALREALGAFRADTR